MVEVRVGPACLFFLSRAVPPPMGTKRALTTHLHALILRELSGQGLSSGDFLQRITLNNMPTLRRDSEHLIHIRETEAERLNNYARHRSLEEAEAAFEPRTPLPLKADVT